MIGAKCFRIRFDKIDLLEFVRIGFIRIYGRTRYLTLLGSEKYELFYNRIRYIISLKSSITYVFSHCYTKIKVDCYYSLSIEKKIDLKRLHVIIIIKSVLNKDKNHYYYHILLEKCLYQLAKK